MWTDHKRLKIVYFSPKMNKVCSCVFSNNLRKQCRSSVPTSGIKVSLARNFLVGKACARHRRKFLDKIRGFWQNFTIPSHSDWTALAWSAFILIFFSAKLDLQSVIMVIINYKNSTIGCWSKKPYIIMTIDNSRDDHL